MSPWNNFLSNAFGFSEESPEEQTQKRISIELAVFAFISGIGYNLIYGYLIYPEKNYVSIASLVFFILAIAFYFFTKNYQAYKIIILSIFIVFGLIAQISLGGFVDGSGVVLCTILPALGALIFGDFKLARIFFYLFIVACIAAGAWEYLYGTEVYRFPKYISLIFFVANFVSIGAICFFLIQSFYLKMTESQKQLNLEKEKSESLLLNILPPSISEELKNGGEAKARGYASATVIFVDIVGFSKMSKLLTPGELVLQLDTYFRVFDDIMEKHNVEKIKTIGDAYLAVAGIPEESFTHASDAVAAALDMQKSVAIINKQGIIRQPFQLRIGVHSGPLITGVVGKKKFTYDIWGDTVNIAARMEQHGESGQINISESTFNLIQHKYKCTPRGKISAKNVGELEMYFVEKNSP